VGQASRDRHASHADRFRDLRSHGGCPEGPARHAPPTRKMFEVELADAIIRIFDLAGSQNLDLGGAIAEKLAYNAQRQDHKREVRALGNGKAF
jgi:hypothetical protein